MDEDNDILTEIIDVIIDAVASIAEEVLESAISAILDNISNTLFWYFATAIAVIVFLLFVFEYQVS